MNREIELVLPYPPSANRYFRVFKGRAVESAVAKEYKKVVKELTAGRIATPWAGPIVMHMDVFRPIRSGDLSNRVKVMEDALRGIVYVDDKQVIDIHPRLWDDKSYPGIQLRVVETFEVREPPPRWEPPPGWEAANARLEAVREKDRERDRKRRSMAETKERADANHQRVVNATDYSSSMDPDEVGQEVLRQVDKTFERWATPAYRKGST